MNIDQFISKLESSDAYQSNKAVRKLVSDSRQVLIDLGHGNDGEAFKAELRKFNDRLDVALNPNVAKVRKIELVREMNLERQYMRCVDTVFMFGLLRNNPDSYGDAHLPLIEETLDSFTLDMLELAATFQEPTLLLVPETSFAAKVKAIDNHRSMKSQSETYQADLYKKSDSGSEKIAGWRAVIVDGAKEMELKEGDDVKQRFDKRIEARKAGRRPEEKGMDRHAYALLMMEYLRKGEPIDEDTYTLLDDDPAMSASDMPGVGWDYGSRQVAFGAGDPGSVNDHARFRSSVGGDVLLNAVEASETVEKFNLAEQYEKRIETLTTFGFVENPLNPSIQGIDHMIYLAPTLEQIKERLTPEKLKLIETHIKNPMLLLVPFAMPLRTIAEKAGQKKGKLDQNPVNAENYDIDSDLPDRGEDDEELIYFPGKFDQVYHGGLSKSEIIGTEGGPNSFPGWQVLVVDGTETIPEDTLNKSAIELQAEFDALGLSGLTPEEWLLFHIEGVLKGIPFDDYTKNSYCWNLASYLKGGSVPDTFWDPEGSEAYLDCGLPPDSDEDLGSRRAVRL